MPRPCAVESHAHRYKRQSEEFSDATALCRGVSRSPLQKTVRRVFGCHGLVPWSLTLAATKDNSEGFSDATALCRGVSRSPLQKTVQKGFQMPRPCAVESHAHRYKRQSE